MIRKLSCAGLLGFMLLLVACAGTDTAVDPNRSETAEAAAEAESPQPTEQETSDASTQAGTPDAPVRLSVTTLPILDMSAFFYAIEEGLFADRNLEVEPVSSTGGALGIPAMISGEVDVVFSNSMSILLAADEGLDLRIIAGNNGNSPDTERDYGAVVVAPESDIAEPADLVGKQVAVNTLNNINWVYMRTWLRSEGVNVEDVTLVELPFPQHPQALLEGDVDAVMTVEPFLLGLLDEGATILGFPYRTHGDTSIAHFVTTSAFVEEHPDRAAAFQAALAQAMVESADPANEEKLSAALEKHTGMTQDVMNRAVFPELDTKISVETMRGMGELMVQEGLLEQVPDVESIIHETAR